MNDELSKNGFIILKSHYSKEEIAAMKEKAMRYFENGGGFRDSTGRAKPDWIKEESLKDLKELVNSEKLRLKISELIGEEVQFISHNDLHINRSVAWHKDTLRGEEAKFQTLGAWDKYEDQEMQIYKVNIYLQDHSNNDGCLTVRKGSHKFSQLGRGIVCQTYPEVGDIIVFDQRITHKATYTGGYDRLLICLGYGVPNEFFYQFKKGTEFRQNRQNNINGVDNAGRS
tara:strand:+ start:4732 stop:5415 length:684 start_codon:yes stop_codon:yes gene_type:complete